MVQDHPNTRTLGLQGYLGELGQILALVKAPDLIATLEQERWGGRHGYPVETMWRAYVASFVLNLPHTNALIRRLEDDSELRRLCGFDDVLPHRTTFNRFIQRLSHHADLVEACFVQLTEQLRELLPDLGEEVAIDSTFVRSHCSPHREPKSDPEASWTAKNSPQAKEGGKEWRHGYKLHMVADSNYGLPLGNLVTSAKRNDSPELPVVMEKARGALEWLRPAVATADRGYDSQSNHDYLMGKGTLPIILRRRSSRKLYQGIYTEEGVPTCIGQVPMEYVRSDPEKGHLYRCAGCHLKDSTQGMTTHCTDEVWEDPGKDLHLFGVVRRGSPEWKAHYAKRQAIERVFKSLKESRRLERHCIRGLRQVTLHSLMSVLTYQATALVRVLDGRRENMRWMVRKIG